MGALRIPINYDENSILLADDEPEHLDWLVDYLEAKGKKVVIATNVKEALDISQSQWFRVYIIDLNIPLGGWPEQVRSMYINYPGLAIIEAIRSQGNDGRRVIAYSAHLNDNISSEMRRLYTDYIAKGRPNQLKERLLELWQLPDQTNNRLAASHARRVAVVSKKTLIPAKKTVKGSPIIKKARKTSSAKKNAVMKVIASAPKQKRSTSPQTKHIQKANSVSQKRR